MMNAKRAAAGAIAVAMATASIGATHVAYANGGFDVTANGVSNGGTIPNLPPSSTVTLAITDLPSNVGLYAFHCLVPADPRSAPTRCDDGTGTFVYIPATGSVVTTSRPIVINGEFLGKNPNPMSGDPGTTPVNCRVDSCAIYTLGAGRDSTNPAYIRVFNTAFAPVAPRVTDRAVVKLNDRKVRPGRDRFVSYTRTKTLSVTLRSGIKPSLSSKRCSVRKGKIRALAKRGTCTVIITAPGNADYLPLRTKVTFTIRNVNVK